MTLMYVIYKNPKDYPEYFVVRRWAVTENGAAPEETACVCADLAQARRSLPPNAIFLGRQPGDDVAILEVWI